MFKYAYTNNLRLAKNIHVFYKNGSSKSGTLHVFYVIALFENLTRSTYIYQKVRKCLMRVKRVEDPDFIRVICCEN